MPGAVSEAGPTVTARTVQINDVSTSFVCSKYSDATLLIISQLGVAGTVIQARRDATFEGRSTYSTHVLMGKRDEPVLELIARQLAEMALGAGSGSGDSTRQLVLGLALSDHALSGARQLTQAVAQLGLL